MSNLSGIFPNAITPTVNLPTDPEQQAQLRRQKEAAVFSPVGASEATAAGQNRTGARQNNPTGTSASSARPANAAPAEESGSGSEATTRQASRPNETRGSSEADQKPGQDRIDQQRLEEELETIRELARRDREVRSHEQAHQAVGGQYAGAMSLTYTTGPDGKRYAVAGEVGIDISPVPGDPQATMAKAERIRRAALAPAEPSSQDRAVAAQATQLQLDAQAELRQLEREARAAAEQETEESRAINEESEQKVEGSEATAKANESQKAREAADEEARERQSQALDTTLEVTDRALVADQYRQSGNNIGENLDFLV